MNGFLNLDKDMVCKVYRHSIEDLHKIQLYTDHTYGLLYYLYILHKPLLMGHKCQNVHYNRTWHNWGNSRNRFYIYYTPCHKCLRDTCIVQWLYCRSCLKHRYCYNHRLYIHQDQNHKFQGHIDRIFFQPRSVCKYRTHQIFYRIYFLTLQDHIGN